jgi:mono/diheme cytochrome c family protein
MKKVLKWAGIILGGLVGLVVVAFVATQLIAIGMLNKSYDFQVESVEVPNDAESIENGERLASVYDCKACHSTDLSGQEFINDPPLGVIFSENLTSGEGGVGSQYTDEDWVRAIRHGIDRNGTPLYIMPSEAFYYMGDEDLGDLIAYLKSMPPVDQDRPERKFGPMGRALIAVGFFPPPAASVIPHTAPRPEAPEPGITAEYGEYLTWACKGCHGPDLKGAPVQPEGYMSPDLTLTGMAGNWSEEEFITAIRTGVRPDDTLIDAEKMPWPYYTLFTDDELKAIYTYFHSLE